MQKVERNLASGVVYQFLYAEPPTTPVLLNEPHHMPVHPWMDYRFLELCHSRGVPVVLFYSDVQWRLPHYPRRIGWAKYLFMLPFFHLDLAVYRRCVDAWLVPELGMRPQIAGWVEQKPSWPSAPGFDPSEQPPTREPRAPDAGLRLFYVGGVEPPVYDLTPLLSGVASAAGRGVRCELTICCREPEWARVAAAYQRFLGDHVHIVHNRSRTELLELYATHDVAVMPYGTLNSDWAMPIKFAEAIGMETPVLAGEGTAVGRVVAQLGIGWVVGSTPEEFVQTVARINAAEIELAHSAIVRVRPDFSWTERAREIARIAEEVRIPSARAGREASPSC